MDPLEEQYSTFRCRVCESKDFLINIFLNEAHQIAEKLCYCASIQISENDGLPQHICTNCFADLQISYTFRLRCEETDAKLRTSSDVLLKTETLQCVLPSEVEFVPEDLDTWNCHINDETKIPLIESSLDICEDDASLIQTDSSSVELKAAISVDSIPEVLAACDSPTDIEPGLVYPVEASLDVYEEEDALLIEKDLNDVEPTTATILDSMTDQSRTRKTHRTFTCHTCQAQFSRGPDYFLHIRTHGAKRFQCKLCLKWFSRKKEWERHGKAHSGVLERLPCKLCTKDFSCRKTLRRHIESIHEHQRKYVCDLCGQAFTQKPHLQNHQNIHKGVQYECTLCDAKFKTFQSCRRHKEMHLPPEERNPKLIAPKKSLKRKTYSSRNYMCSFCGRVSTTLQAHQIHERTHTGVKPYPCTTCGKAFIASGMLKKHMLIHTGEKPHKCETCGKFFRIKAHLTTHYITHTHEKNFVCQICSKAYASKSSLKSHMKSHSVCEAGE